MVSKELVYRYEDGIPVLSLLLQAVAGVPEHRRCVSPTLRVLWLLLQQGETEHYECKVA